MYVARKKSNIHLNVGRRSIKNHLYQQVARIGKAMALRMDWFKIVRLLHGGFGERKIRK